MVRKNNWAEDRVFFFADDGQLTQPPGGAGPTWIRRIRSWHVAAGRSAFRVEDLAGPGRVDRRAPARKPGPGCKANYAASVKENSPELPSGQTNVPSQTMSQTRAVINGIVGAGA